MNPISFTPEVIGGLVGLVLTLIFAYFPGLNVAYAGLKSEVKSYIMLGLLVAAAAIITLLAQQGIIPTTAPVTWLDFGKVVLALLIANQPTYTLLPEAKAVKQAKLARV